MRFTPKKTLSLIVEGGNDYVVAVKANQRKLYRQIETIVRDRRPAKSPQPPSSVTMAVKNIKSLTSALRELANQVEQIFRLLQ